MNLSPISKNDLLLPPTNLEAKHARWALMMSAASKVAIVALAAIAAATSAVFLLGITLTGSMPLLLMGSVLATPLLMFASAKAADESAKADRLYEQEKAIGEALQEFKNLDQDQFASVCRQLSIDPESTIYSPEEFDILVARLAFWNKRAQTTLEKANRHIYADHPENVLQKIDESKATPAQVSLLRYATRDTGFRILEQDAIPAMLQSALILQVLRNTAQAPALEAVGILYPKTMAVRLCEQIFDQNDTYMTFFDPSRAPLTTREIIDLFRTDGPAALQQRMFA